MLHDLSMIRDAKDLGLSLNATKSEIISQDLSTCRALVCSLPGTQLVDLSCVLLLGSPLGDDSCISTVLSKKCDHLRRLEEFLSTHDALVLLRYSFVLPMLQYLLHTASSFHCSALESYDECLHNILYSFTNTSLGSNSEAWL